MSLVLPHGNIEAMKHTPKTIGEFARAYSKKARVVVPSLVDYEEKILPMPLAVNQQS